jgi:hypothetical protein
MIGLKAQAQHCIETDINQQAKFAAWLASLRPNTTVGSAQCQLSCPLANWAYNCLKKLGLLRLTIDMCPQDYTVSFENPDNPTMWGNIYIAVDPLPTWMQTFISQVDRLYCGEIITAAYALQVLRDMEVAQ